MASFSHASMFCTDVAGCSHEMGRWVAWLRLPGRCRYKEESPSIHDSAYRSLWSLLPESYRYCWDYQECYWSCKYIICWCTWWAFMRLNVSYLEPFGPKLVHAWGQAASRQALGMIQVIDGECLLCWHKHCAEPSPHQGVLLLGVMKENLQSHIAMRDTNSGRCRSKTYLTSLYWQKFVWGTDAYTA